MAWRRICEGVSFHRDSWLGAFPLILLTAAALLPGYFALPPIDRDEPRFAQASRQMAHSSRWIDWIVPRIQDEPRLRKPPLVYWLQAAIARGLNGPFGFPAISPANLAETSTRPTTATPAPRRAADPAPAAARGRAIGVYRLASLLSAIVAVLCTWRLAATMLPPAAAALSAALLATMPLLLVDGRLARADTLLLACTTAMQLALWCAWQAVLSGRSTAVPVVLFWGALLAGALAKGPIAPLIAAFTVFTIGWVTGDWRLLRRVRPVLGLITVTAVSTGWIALVAAETGWARIGRTILGETVGRGLIGRDGHGAPPGYYLLHAPLLAWPAMLGLGVVLAHAIGGLRRAATSLPRGGGWRAAFAARAAAVARALRGDHATLFLVAWLVPGWLFFESAMTKLPHYVLPLLPAAVILAARALQPAPQRSADQPAPLVPRFAIRVWLAIGLALFVVLPIVVAALLEQAQELHVYVVACICVVLLAVVARRAERGQLRSATLLGGLVTVIAANYLFGVLLPAGERIWIAARAAERLAALDPGGLRPLASAGYIEDSLVFLTNGRLQRLIEGDADLWVDQNPGGILLASEDALPTRNRMRSIAQLEGFNFSTGKAVKLRFLERDASSATAPAP